MDKHASLPFEIRVKVVKLGILKPDTYQDNLPEQYGLIEQWKDNACMNSVTLKAFILLAPITARQENGLVYTQVTMHIKVDERARKRIMESKRRCRTWKL